MYDRKRIALLFRYCELLCFVFYFFQSAVSRSSRLASFHSDRTTDLIPIFVALSIPMLLLVGAAIAAAAASGVILSKLKGTTSKR